MIRYPIIDIFQFLVTISAAIYALYQYRQSRIDKRHDRVHALLMKLHDDKEFRKYIYEIDKNIKLDEIRWRGKKEIASDRILQFVNYLGYMIKEKQINSNDLNLYSYELKLIINCCQLSAYKKWLQNNGIPFTYIIYVQNALTKFK